jgi:hypothetical protein
MADNEPRFSKRERLNLVYNRLDNEQPAANHDEALTLIARVLNEVEDEFSGVPYNPDEPGTDGRMYPPNTRFRYKNWERPGIHCYRQVAHATFIAENGALEIRSRSGTELGNILYEKPGKDGKKVSDYDSSA